MFKSVSARLNAGIVIIVTALLLVSGTIEALMQREDLNALLKTSANALNTRLSQALPAAMWNMDNNQIQAVLVAEMSAPEIDSITVLPANGEPLTAARDASGKVVFSKTATNIPDNLVSEAPLTYSDNGTNKPIGKVQTSLSARGVAQAFRTSIIRLVVQIVLLDILLVLILNRVVHSVVLVPLRRARDAFKEIASSDADLTRKLDDTRGDEFGELAKYFNAFVASLHDLFLTVRNQAVSLGGDVSDLRKATQAIASQSRSQTEISSATAATIEEITVSIAHIADNAHVAEEQASETSSVAQKSVEAVSTLIGSIDGISSSVQQLSGTLSELGDRSNQITGIVAVINDIADQTNLLALNAAIEAARAGEQGRGFAVVADEVRKLAERTAKATIEIRELIAMIGKDIQSALTEMNQTQQSVSGGMSTSQQVVTQIGSIGERIGKVVHGVQEIANASREQSAATTDLARVAEQSDRMIQETDDSIRTVSGTVSALNELSASLQALVGRFRL